MRGVALAQSDLPSARVLGCATHPRDGRSPDGRCEPSAPPDDRGHDGPQSGAGNPAILRACGGQVQPVLRSFAGSAGSRGRARVPGASGCRRHVLAGAQPDRLCLALLFGVTLGRADLPERIPHAREPRKLPVVLSADEVVRFLEAVAGLKCRAALTTAYAAGLRASEVASLKVADIDSSRMVIRVELGKGGRDRYVMLSPQLLGIPRAYWRLARPPHW